MSKSERAGHALRTSELPAIDSMATIVRSGPDYESHKAFDAIGGWMGIAQVPVATPPTPIQLFRAEALEAQSAKSGGEPAGLMPQSWTAMTALLLAIVGAAAVFPTTASYARKETARGILRPTDGEVRAA